MIMLKNSLLFLEYVFEIYWPLERQAISSADM